MSTTTTEEWVPTTPEEKALKEAFETGLGHATDRVIKEVSKPEGGVKKRFILDTLGYYDLQNYVFTGMEFPSSNAEFQQVLPESAFKKLTEIDSTIYEITRDTMVKVSQSCRDFNQNSMGKLINAASAAIQYSKTAIEYLEEADGTNLRSQLDILMDPKYKTPDDYDARFNEAREGATMTLYLLKDEANTKKKEVERIKDNLIAFKNETLKYHEKVDYLRKQYSTGPVTNDTGHTEPYIEYLDKELAQLSAKLKDAIDKSRKEYDKWASATGTAIATAWFGIIGWIVMGIKTDEAIKARKAYDELQDQIAKYNSDKKEIANLIMHVSRLIEQFDDLLPKMETAIKAMAELGSLFTSQADSYDQIASAIKGLGTGAASDSWKNRTAFITYQLKRAIANFKELQESALEFRETAVRQTELPPKT